MSTFNVDQIAERMFVQAVRREELEKAKVKQAREELVGKLVGEMQPKIESWMKDKDSIQELTWTCKTFVGLSLQLEAAQKLCAKYKGEKYRLAFRQNVSNYGADVLVFRFVLN